jgi:frataxin-like iron-binding protein CyaY
MNQAAAQFGLGYHVAQKHGEWCVHRNGTQFRFDGEKIILDRPES